MAPAVPISSKVALQSGLHAGEAAALTLALMKHADAVLMDESAGRSAARNLGMTAIGVLGILLQAKRAGHIAAIKPVLAQLENEAGFWLSPTVVLQVLIQAGE